jgi:hypothetical protein
MKSFMSGSASVAVKKAFLNARIQNLIMLDGIETIGASAFENCIGVINLFILQA